MVGEVITKPVYCDPPYLHHTRSSTRRYRFDYEEQDHIELLEILKGLPCSVILSGYPSNVYNELLTDWGTLELQVMNQRTEIRGKDEIAQLADAFNVMAERLAQMIKGSKELNANVSRELRSPLARIRVAEEIIRTQLKKGETKKASKYLNDIQREIHELDRLIGRILEFSKLDLKASSPEKVPVNLSDPVVQILSRFKTIIQKKEITCETGISSGLYMKGDKKGLESALSNLLDNAVKFSPEGGRVTVRLMRTQDHLELTVFNTFQKLNDEALKHLFEPFYREADTEASGTGLGLSIAKKIIERHGGRIVAANATDGIEFMVRFPS